MSRILALLALAVGSSALEINTEMLTTVSEDLHNYLSSTLRSFVKEHARPEPALPLLKNQTECKACVQEGAKFVLGHTVSKMKTMCAAVNTSNDPKSCMAGKICGMMGKHPKVMLGMMMEHVRPMSLSTAYCTGKGACEHPDQITMSEIAMGNEPHEALLDNFDQVDWSEVTEEAQELIPIEHDEQMGDTEAHPCQEMRKKMPVCPMCMKKAMRHAMGHGIMKVKAMCKKEMNKDGGCPVMKKMCPWMAKNKAVALGMLIAKMEPWKFAFGYCLHKKKSYQQSHLPPFASTMTV
jgi:hypothetical protein